MLCQQCQLLELQSWTLGLPAAALLCAILIGNILRFWITKNMSSSLPSTFLWAIKWNEQKWASCLNVFKVILHLREIKYFLFDFISIRIGGDNLISCCAGRWRFTPYQTFSFYIFTLFQHRNWNVTFVVFCLCFIIVLYAFLSCFLYKYPSCLTKNYFRFLVLLPVSNSNPSWLKN